MVTVWIEVNVPDAGEMTGVAACTFRDVVEDVLGA
jgi:hypothetical protein